MGRDTVFPGIVSDLPQADIPIEGLKSYLLQGEDQQVVFMSFENDISVPEHSHEAQWGVVVDGEIRLTIDGRLHVLTRGDSYFIPKGVAHSARIKAGYKDVTLFDQKDRYSVRSEQRHI
jgi:quercetin dioxygenase-like cupin family protein